MTSNSTKSKKKKKVSELGYSVELNDTTTNDKSLRQTNTSSSDPDKELSSPFPLLSLIWCDNGMILTFGGGGPTKSGLASGFEVLRLDSTYSVAANSFENVLQRHSWFNTGPDIVYAIAVHPKYPFQMIAAVSNSIVILELNNPFDTKQKPFDFEWKVMCCFTIYTSLHIFFFFLRVLNVCCVLILTL